MNKEYAPVFEKDRVQFIIWHRGFSDKDEDEAYKIGFGTTLMEGIIFKFKFTGKSIPIFDGSTKKGKEGELGNLKVIVLDEADHV